MSFDVRSNHLGFCHDIFRVDFVREHRRGHRELAPAPVHAGVEWLAGPRPDLVERSVNLSTSVGRGYREMRARH